MLYVRMAARLGGHCYVVKKRAVVSACLPEPTVI